MDDAGIDMYRQYTVASKLAFCVHFDFEFDSSTSPICQNVVEAQSGGDIDIAYSFHFFEERTLIVDGLVVPDPKVKHSIIDRTFKTSTGFKSWVSSRGSESFCCADRWNILCPIASGCRVAQSSPCFALKVAVFIDFFFQDGMVCEFMIFASKKWM